MSRIDQLGTENTTIRTEQLGSNPDTIVTYYQTEVVRFNTKQIALNHGGYLTKSTVMRMNQASNQFALGYQVHIKDGVMYVTFKGKELKFYGTKRVLDR